MQRKTASTRRRLASKKSGATPTAIHAKHRDGKHHIVGLGNLRVLLIPEDGGWFAQGLEIDYAAQGNNKKEAKKEFEDGLEATVQSHLTTYGNILKLLKVAPDEAWKRANDPNVRLNRYSQVTVHHVVTKNSNYNGISYLVASQATAAA